MTGNAFHVEGLFYFTDQRGGRRGSANDDARQAAEIVILALRAIYQGRRHDGHKATSARAFGFNEPENLFGIEALDHNVLAAKQCEQVRYTPTVGVE